MIDDIVLENSLGLDGMRVLHVMGGAPVHRGWLDVVPDTVRRQAEVKRWEDNMHLHHLQMKWPAREVVPWAFLKVPFPLIRTMVLWYVGQPVKVGLAIKDAIACFALGLGEYPQYAWVREIPKQAEEGFEINGVMMIQAGWVPVGFVAVGRGGDLIGQVPTFEKVAGG